MKPNNQKLEIIHESALLSSLNRHPWARLLSYLEPCTFHEGDAIQQPNEPITAFHQFSKSSPPHRFEPSANASKVMH